MIVNGIDWFLVALCFFLIIAAMQGTFAALHMGCEGGSMRIVGSSVLLPVWFMVAVICLAMPVRYTEETYVADYVVKNGEHYECRAGGINYNVKYSKRSQEYSDFFIKVRTEKPTLDIFGTDPAIVTLYGPPFSGNEEYGGDSDNVVLKGTK